MTITRKIATYGAGIAVASSGLLGLGIAAAPMAHADSPDVASVSCSTAKSTATITPGITTSPPTAKIAVKAPSPPADALAQRSQSPGPSSSARQR